MAHLSLEAKQAIVTKALTANSRGIKELARSHNIGYSTVLKWLKEYREGRAPFGGATLGRDLTPSERFGHLVATAALDEAALGVYCREKGLYSHQLNHWKDEFMTKDNSESKRQHSAELKALKAENKRLQKELNRKDKALAETAALLILKKKANLLWGVPEDDQ